VRRRRLARVLGDRHRTQQPYQPLYLLAIDDMTLGQQRHDRKILATDRNRLPVGRRYYAY
jgi:hypothetical protein